MKNDDAQELCVLCRALVQEEGYSPLIGLGEKRGIEPHMMIHLCDAAADISQYRKEGRTQGLAMLVGNKEVLEGVLVSSTIDLKRSYQINSFRRELRKMAGLAEGRFLVLTMNPKGKILGIRRVFKDALSPRYQEEERNVSPLYSGAYLHMAVISKMTDSLCFYVPPEGNAVKVYDSGRIVAQYSMGDWCIADYDGLWENLSPVGLAVTRENGIEAEGERNDFQNSLLKLLRVAVLMSSCNVGTIFSLDASGKGTPRRRAALSRMIDLTSREVHVTELEDEELLNIASLDGAVLVDSRGRLREFNAILGARSARAVDIHYGARHEAARNYSRGRESAIVIVVSQDGAITVFFKGKVVAGVRTVSK